ncbi:MAG: hypothetical protein IKC19_04055 [Bacteroidales bacterium]|nr:hypothetical protein [Bacteroidales bacterium]
MKSYFRILCIVACAVFMVSCNDEIKFHQFKMDHLNLGDTKYLALATGQSNGTKDAESSQQYLYSIDEEGNMQVVAYEYQCDDDGVATELSRRLTLNINQMVPVGDNYIWLVGCRYECKDYEGFSESMQDAIRGLVNHSKQNFGENFLIRKRDGKIFDLNDVIVKFPICQMYVPGLGSVGLVGYGGDNGLPIDGDLTGDRLRKLGLINQLGNDIYLASGSYQGGLARLHDNGSTISIYNMLDYNIGYSVSDNQGHLGTTICYSGNSPDVASIMAPDFTLPAIQGIPVASNDYCNYPEMRCIGGKYFVSVRVNMWDGEKDLHYDSIYLVDVSTSPATATGVAEGYFCGDEYETYSTTVYVSDEENYSWVSGTTLYTFNSNTYQLTQSTLPAGWPQYSMFDAEGYCYQPHMGNGLQSFTVYNLATQQTEEVACDRSQVPSFNYHAGCNYDGGLSAFIESVIMADGSTTTLITDVKGPARGITRVQSQTEANNNVEVSTLIPLN